MRILNILNGDLALAPFRASGLPGEALVWREIYTEGPLGTGSEDPETFRRLRAHFLTGIVPDRTEPELLRGLEKMDHSLLSMTRQDHLRIWADACMFDQGIVARVLFLTAHLERENRPRVELLEKDAVFSDPELFRTLDRNGSVLTQEQVDFGNELWKAYALSAPSLSRPLPPVFHFMREALERHAAERPSDGEAGLTVRRILARTEQACSPLELFRDLAAMEKHPFLGDSSLWRIVDALSAAGHLRLTDGKGHVIKQLRREEEELAACRIERTDPSAENREKGVLQ